MMVLQISPTTQTNRLSGRQERALSGGKSVGGESVSQAQFFFERQCEFNGVEGIRADISDEIRIVRREFPVDSKLIGYVVVDAITNGSRVAGYKRPGRICQVNEPKERAA